MNRQINFIGIGAQKCGTSWLFARMKELSEFSLPYKKEIHYFDRSKNYYSQSELTEEFLINRLKNPHFINKSVYNTYKSIIKSKSNQEVKWVLKWFFSNYTDKWYLSLFKPFKGITGEITPSYAMLNDEDIKKMYSLLPDIKIIYLIRNPIDRAWSHYRYSLKLKGVNKIDYDLLSEEKIIEFINGEDQHLRSDYNKTIDNFRKYYSNNNFLLGFYDAIIEQPENLLTGIVNFLGGDISKIKDECDPRIKNNVSPKVEIPENIKNLLLKKYTPMIEELSLKYGGYFTHWHNDLQDNNKNESNKLNQSHIILN